MRESLEVCTGYEGPQLHCSQGLTLAVLRIWKFDKQDRFAIAETCLIPPFLPFFK